MTDDPHRRRAAVIFGVGEDMITKPLRDYAKLRSHAEAYGASLKDVDLEDIEKRLLFTEPYASVVAHVNRSNKQ